MIKLQAPKMLSKVLVIGGLDFEIYLVFGPVMRGITQAIKLTAEGLGL